MCMVSIIADHILYILQCLFFTIVHVEVLVKLTMMLTKGRKNKQEVVNVPARPWCYILHIADNQNRTTCAKNAKIA